jgi:hypothetical protein
MMVAFARRIVSFQPIKTQPIWVSASSVALIVGGDDGGTYENLSVAQLGRKGHLLPKKIPPIKNTTIPWYLTFPIFCPNSLLPSDLI